MDIRDDEQGTSISRSSELEIQDTLIQRDRYNPIVKNLSLVERLIEIYYKIFKRESLMLFYKKCGLAQIEKTVSSSNKWYDIQNKTLTDEFAQILFGMIKSLSILFPVFEKNILSPNIKKVVYQEELLIIEMVFHVLRTGTSVHQYPFSRENMTKTFQSISVDELIKTKKQFLETYLSEIEDSETEFVDQKYSMLYQLCQLYNVSLRDFIKRFNYNFSIEHKDDDLSFTPVTLVAVEYYLKSLWDLVMTLEVTKDDFKYIKALYSSNQEIFPDSQIIDRDEMEEAWNTLVKNISALQENKNLTHLLCLSQKNPLVDTPPLPQILTICEKFKSALYTRVLTLAEKTSLNIYRNKMSELIEMAVFSRVSRQIDTGIYSIENNFKIQNICKESLTNVYAITAIYYFMEDHVMLWLKNFFTFLSINGEFQNSSDALALEESYKSILRFEKSFEKFVLETNHESTISQRINKFIHNKELSPAELQLLMVFLNSLNYQATRIVDSFQEIFMPIKRIVDAFMHDYDGDSNYYLTNLSLFKKTIDSEQLVKLYDLHVFCQHMSSILDLEYKMTNSGVSNE